MGDAQAAPSKKPAAKEAQADKSRREGAGARKSSGKAVAKAGAHAGASAKLAGAAATPAVAVSARVAQREPALVPRLTAQTPQGGHYLPSSPVRSDLAEGAAGVPLSVRIVVVDQTGLPFQGAIVDVWHADARGVYSGFEAQGDDRLQDTRGQTFLRGRQLTDRNGVAAFGTLYPGWHAGRTAHIHFKVWNGAVEVLNSEVLLPDALSEYVYLHRPEYRRERLRETLNSTDAVAVQAGNSVLGSIREEREQYVVTLAVAVDRSGRAPEPVQPAELVARTPTDAAGRLQALLPGRRP